VERFDHEQEQGAIIGIARTLGEGIDIETADVCINRGRGRLSRSLVQRMGRILRNPNGDKEAQFFHITGIPTRSEALLPREDGVSLIETSSQLLDWGEGFRARPIFTIDSETSLTERKLAELESTGQTAIEQWTPNHYELPNDEGVRKELESLCSLILDCDGSALLSIERVERHQAPDERIDTPAPDDEDSADTIPFVTADGGTIEMAGWLHELTHTATEDVESFIEDSVRAYLQESLRYPNSNAVPDTEEEKPIELNPALDAVLSVYSDNKSRTAIVHAAIAEAIEDDLSELYNEASPSVSRTKIDEAMKHMLETADE
jgi:hypothetical protein